MASVSESAKKHIGIISKFIFIILITGLFTVVGIAQDKRVISLREAIEIAMKNYPDFKQSGNSVELSHIDLNTKKSLFLPDLNAGSTFSHKWGKIVDTTTGNYSNSDYSGLNLSITSNLNIFNGFKNVSLLKESRLKSRAATGDHLRFRLEVIFLTFQKYVNVLTAKEFIEVEKENLEAQTLMLEKIDDFFKAGKKPITDLYQQKADIARSRLNLMDARQNFIMAKLDLNNILGLENIDDFLLERPDTSIRESLKGFENEEEILKYALKMRKDLKARELELEAAGKSINVAKSGYWPKLSLFATFNSNYSGLDAIYSYWDQLFDNHPSLTSGLTLSVPIFNRNSVKNSVASAKVMYENSELELEKKIRKITFEIRQSIANFNTAISQIKAAESQVKYSKAALQSISDRYNVNASTITDLTQARALYKQAGFDLIKAKYNLLTKKAAIYFYSGNGEKLISLLSGKN